MTRIGASQVFFNVVAQWNADKMVSDAKTQMTIMKAVVLDSFEAMLKPVNDFTSSLNMMTAELSESSQELGKAVVEFEKFFGSENLDATADALMRIGESYAIVGSEAIAAGSRAAQVANLIGRQNVDLLVDQANILSAISDLNAEEAQRGIIQLQQQTGILYGNLSREEFNQLSVMEKRIHLTNNSAKALDTLNTIANRSVAMEGDLVKTLSNFAAQGSLIGENFHDMAAMSAVLLEAGEEQGASGRALRMMYARLGGNISGTRDKLEALGIATKDENGNLFTMRQLMDNLVRDGYHKLNPEQQQNIAQIISGNRHYVRFIKLMQNHNRVVELAADGMAGYDSAQAQAIKAMESMTMELEKQRAIQENLDAALGQEMTPFMIGQLEATNSMKQAYVELLSIMPTFGNFLGRLVGSFEQFEGFLRFSIGLQSMAIGFEMMDSVQRSLHGILIANENLHSKQATHLEYGVQASKDQNAMMNRIRYQAQLVNTHQESIRMAKHEQLAIDQQRLPLRERAVNLNQQIADRHVEITEKQKEQESIAFRLSTLSDRRLNDSTKINRMLAQDKEFAKEMATTFHNINTGQHDFNVKQDSFASQMLVNMKAASGLSEEQLQDQYAQVAALRDQRTVLQMIHAENQVAFQLRSNQRGLEENQVKVAKELQFNVNDLAKAYNFINNDLQVYEQRLKKITGETEKEKTDRAKIEAQMDMQARLLEQIEEKMNQMRSGGPITPFDLDKNQSGYIIGAIKQINGELMARTKILESATLKEMDQAEVTRRQTMLQDTLNTLREKEITDLNELESILDPLLQAEEQYANLQKIVEQGILDRVEAEELKREIMYALEGGLDSLSARTKKLIKVDQDFRREKELAAQATGRMVMATSSLVTIMSGTGVFGLSGAMAGATSSVMMLAPAFAQVGKSVNEYIKNQLTMMKLQKQNNWFMTKGAYLLYGMVAAYGAALYGMYLLNKEQERRKKLMEDINSMAARQSNIMGRLYGDLDQQLIQNEALNSALDLQGVTLRELHSDENRRIQVLNTLADAQGKYSDEMGDSVDEALALTAAIDSLDGSLNKVAITSFMAGEGQRIEQRLFGEATDRLGLSFGLAGDKVEDANEAMFDFYNLAMGTDYDPSKGRLFGESMFKATEVQDAIETYILQGGKLTDEFMYQLGVLYGSNEEFIRYVEVLNSMAMTTDDAALAQENFDRVIEDTGVKIGQTTEDIKNLTEEIYQFGGAREELFFGGKYGNVTGSLYKQVVTQGVGTLYNKNEVIVSTNFHGFFNEQEAADRIIRIVTQHLDGTLA